MSHLYISAARKSEGKTICTIAMAAALHQRGLRIQTFKKGPDYIDPLWLSRASARECRNLDFHTMSGEEICGLFSSHRRAADLSLIEGNKGLHDSVDRQGKFSNASLAVLLGAPVVLVVDTRGMTRGIASLLRGLVEFDPSVQFAGVILNQVGGTRHERKLRDAIETYTDVSVLGAFPQHRALAIPEAHLGLVPANENGRSENIIADMARLARDHLDMEKLVVAAARARAPSTAFYPAERSSPAREVRLGIARDEAFGFYYPDDLRALEAEGAHLVSIDTLRDSELPDVDGLFLGGGFPERYMDALEANHALRRQIRLAVEAGLAVYAECGGLMYLAKRIIWGEQRRNMVGALPFDIVMHDKPQGRGYVRLKETAHAPWPRLGELGELQGELRAHEFHYSRICNVESSFTYAYDVTRGHGVDGKHDGIVYRNTLASYSHLRETHQSRWTGRFVAHVDRCRQVGMPR